MSAGKYEALKSQTALWRARPVPVTDMFLICTIVDWQVRETSPVLASATVLSGQLAESSLVWSADVVLVLSDTLVNVYPVIEFAQ
jgi:hypothetical protein